MWCKDLILLLIFKVFILLQANVMLLSLKLLELIVEALKERPLLFLLLILIFQILVSFGLLLTKFLFISVLLLFLLCIIMLISNFWLFACISHPRFINSILIFYLTVFLFLLFYSVLMLYLHLSISVLFLLTRSQKVILESLDIDHDLDPIPSSLLN